MTISLQKSYEDDCGIPRKNFRFVSAAISQLEIFGVLQNYLAYCDQSLAFETGWKYRKMNKTPCPWLGRIAQDKDTENDELDRWIITSV